MTPSQVILSTPEKFSSAEIKEVITAKFPTVETHSTSNRIPDLYIIYTVEVWNWLQDWYQFPQSITTFTGCGDWEGKQCIEIPSAG